MAANRIAVIWYNIPADDVISASLAISMIAHWTDAGGEKAASSIGYEQ